MSHEGEGWEGACVLGGESLHNLVCKLRGPSGWGGATHLTHWLFHCWGCVSVLAPPFPLSSVDQIAVEDINSLESEFMALQHSVQK